MASCMNQEDVQHTARTVLDVAEQSIFIGCAKYELKSYVNCCQKNREVNDTHQDAENTEVSAEEFDVVR